MNINILFFNFDLRRGVVQWNVYICVRWWERPQTTDTVVPTVALTCRWPLGHVVVSTNWSTSSQSLSWRR